MAGRAGAKLTWFCFSGDFLFLALLRYLFGIIFYFSRLLKQIQAKDANSFFVNLMAPLVADDFCKPGSWKFWRTLVERGQKGWFTIWGACEELRACETDETSFKAPVDGDCLMNT